MVNTLPSMDAFEVNAPLSEDEISAFEHKHKIALPPCYREFLSRGNGGEGPVGEFGYANLWKLEELAELNQSYQTSEYLPGYLIIGSDGGGEAFAIQLQEFRYVQVPFVGMDEEDCEFLGNTFTEFLVALAKEPGATDEGNDTEDDQ